MCMIDVLKGLVITRVSLILEVVGLEVLMNWSYTTTDALCWGHHWNIPQARHAITDSHRNVYKIIHLRKDRDTCPITMSTCTLTECGLVTPFGLVDMIVNIGSVNALLPDSIMPLPKPMLTYHRLESIPGSYFLERNMCFWFIWDVRSEHMIYKNRQL